MPKPVSPQSVRCFGARHSTRFPQFINVVRGDMSLVGPRPERPVFVEEFSASVPGYDDRHRMRVGLTGLAQIVGLRGDTSIEQRVKYDNIPERLPRA